MSPLFISLVREEFPKEKIPKAEGILAGMNGAGLAAGLPLGSFISNDYGWQTNFHIAIPIVVGLGILAYFVIRESPYKRPNVKVDYVGAALLGSSLAFVILALGEGPSWGWTSTSTLALVLAGLVLLIPLFIYERHYLKDDGEPVLNLKLLGIRNVLTANLVVLVSFFGMLLAFDSFIFKLELPPPVGYGFDIFRTALFILPIPIAMFIFAPITGIVVSKVGIKPMAIIGAMVAASGFLLVAQAATFDELFGLMFIIGAGIAMVMSSVRNLLVFSVEPRDIGLASSMNTVFQNLGNSLGTPVAGSILATFTISVAIGLKNGLPVYSSFSSSAAFQYTFYLAAATFLMIAIIVLFAHEVLGKRAKQAQITNAQPTQETA